MELERFVNATRTVQRSIAEIHRSEIDVNLSVVLHVSCIMGTRRGAA